MIGALGWPCEIAFEATGDYHGGARIVAPSSLR